MENTERAVQEVYGVIISRDSAIQNVVSEIQQIGGTLLHAHFRVYHQLIDS